MRAPALLLLLIALSTTAVSRAETECGRDSNDFTIEPATHENMNQMKITTLTGTSTSSVKIADTDGFASLLLMSVALFNESDATVESWSGAYKARLEKLIKRWEPAAAAWKKPVEPSADPASLSISQKARLLVDAAKEALHKIETSDGKLTKEDLAGFYKRTVNAAPSNYSSSRYDQMTGQFVANDSLRPLQNILPLGTLPRKGAGLKADCNRFEVSRSKYEAQNARNASGATSSSSSGRK